MYWERKIRGVFDNRKCFEVYIENRIGIVGGKMRVD